MFTRTKHGADSSSRIARATTASAAIAIHGNKSQNARTRALADFKRGERPACWSPPTSPRAASTSTSCRTSSTTTCRTCPRTTCTASAAPAAPAPTGEAISLVCVDEHDFLRDIERLIKRQIPQRSRRRLRARSQREAASRVRAARPRAPGPGQGPRQGAGPGRGTERNGRSYGAGAKPTGGNPRSRSGPQGERGNAGHGRGAPRQGARFKAA